MTTPNAACLAEFSLNPLFHRHRPCVYEAVQDCRPDRKKTDAAVSGAITGGSTLNGTGFSGNRSYCMGADQMPKHYKTEPMNK
jgi:hypothetical protein